MHDLDETERQHALLGNLPNDSTLENYVRGTNRNLNKVMSIVKTLQLAMGRVGAAAALEMPRRTKGELKVDFNSRMFAFPEKLRMLDDEAPGGARRARGATAISKGHGDGGLHRQAERMAPTGPRRNA